MPVSSSSTSSSAAALRRRQALSNSSDGTRPSPPRRRSSSSAARTDPNPTTQPHTHLQPQATTSSSSIRSHSHSPSPDSNSHGNGITGNGNDSHDITHKYSRTHRRTVSQSDVLNPIVGLSGLIDSVSAYLDGDPAWGMNSQPTLSESHRARVAELQRLKRPAGADIGSTNLIDFGDDLTVQHDQSAPVLAYLHPVTRADTLVGISIRYGCTASLIRKTNRLWATDLPQVRSILLLPLSGCSVQTQAPEREAEPADDSAWPPLHDTGAGSSEEASVPWKHHSWVVLTGSDASTEVVRIPHKHFIYYPPARRKRESDESGAAADPSAPSTPPPQHSLSYSSHNHYQELRNSPSVPFFGAPGVGSLGGQSARCPGAPASDPLIRLCEKHFPGIIPLSSSTIALSSSGFPFSSSSHNIFTSNWNSSRRPHRTTARTTERERGWSALSAASAASALSDTPRSRRVYGAYPQPGSSASGLERKSHSSTAVSKGLDWIKKMADRAAGTTGNGPSDGREIALFSWLDNDNNNTTESLDIFPDTEPVTVTGRQQRRYTDESPIPSPRAGPVPEPENLQGPVLHGPSLDLPAGIRLKMSSSARTDPTWFSDLIEMVDGERRR